MPLYSVGIASLVIKAPTKWTDNVLTHHHLPEIASTNRGADRGIPHSGLVRLAIIRLLHQDLGLGVRDAVRISLEMYNGDGLCMYRRGPISLAIDGLAVERSVETRLAEVLESAPVRRRGRPARHLPAG